MATIMNITFILVISIFCTFRIIASARVTWEEIQQNIIENPPTETQGYKFQHVNYRTKDPIKAIKFYTEILGMTLNKRMEIQAQSTTVYFLSYPNSGSDFYLELLHEWNYNDDLHTGNQTPKGFSHIGIQVENLEEAFERFRNEGVTIVDQLKTETYGFIKDADGYLIEIAQSSD